MKITHNKITASNSMGTMMKASEGRIDELKVNSCSNINATTEFEAKQVEITHDDYFITYEDVDGGLGESGEIYSLAEIKEYWNENNSGDLVLADYPSFQSWWDDTRKFFLIRSWEG